MTAPETTHLTARVPADLAERLADLADKADRSVSAELRQAIRTYVERLEAEEDGSH